MALFTQAEASHFFSRSKGVGIPDESFRDWVSTLSRNASFSEGSADYLKLSCLAGNEIERLLVLAASHFRRAHDMVSPISSPWAFVTLYYGSYYGASALMGMCGIWKLKKNMSIQVAQSAAGAQRLHVVKDSSTYSGSHQQFWEFYFSNARSLIPAATSNERFALLPVSADAMWLIENRNDLNYDTFKAVDMAAQFLPGIIKSGFPGSLPGALPTQLRFLEALMGVCNRLAEGVGIDTSALSGVTGALDRSSRVRELVVKSKPLALGNKVGSKVICG